MANENGHYDAYGRCCSKIGVVIALVFICLTLVAQCVKRVKSDEAPTTIPSELQRLATDDSVPEWKRNLFQEALNHGSPMRECLVSLYHPKEAEWQVGKGSWPNWTGTATGTKVKPGVASCPNVLRHSKWRGLGAWLWVEGYGVCHVEDVNTNADRHARNHPNGPVWYDLAAPGPPHEYKAWLADMGRAYYARDYGLRPSRFVLLKPDGGWPE